MPDILHRVSVDAPAKDIHDLVATTDGIARWWTGRPVTGDMRVGSEFAVYFGDAEAAAAVLRMAQDRARRVEWVVVDGPADWLDTRIAFTLDPAAEGTTTLLFAHSDWAVSNEFMAGCTTNWGAYLTSLKRGAETGSFAPFPHGEISRWG